MIPREPNLLILLVCAIVVSPWSRAADVVEDDRGILIDHVWAGHPVGFGFLTQDDHQFIAYYDAERRLTVAGRKLNEARWSRVHPEGVPVPQRGRMSTVTGWDSHNRLVLALDREGCLHLSGNMHNDPLVYYRTREPYDLGTLERIDRMTGEAELRVTYPAFLTTPDGDLLFRYRDGGSGDGSDFYNIYDPLSRSWRRLFDGPLLDGEGERSAYGTGPRRGPDGRYHMVWMWRDTPDAMTNHTLSYARSRDLVQWESSIGHPIARPITMAGAEVIDAAEPGEGLINMTLGLGFDAEGRPVVAYHRYDAAGHSQAYLARPTADGGWERHQLSAWRFQWTFHGAGSQPRAVGLGSPVADADGTLRVDFTTNEAGSGQWRVDGRSLKVLETRERPDRTAPTVAGLIEQTAIARASGIRWVLRWETMGVNRELKDRPAPPPSPMRLYRMDGDPDRAQP